jgi:hypothetical protein
VRQRDLQRIAQLERNGTMQRRRDQLRAWFQAHPLATPEDAIRELRYSHPDYMHVIADSIWNDIARAGGGRALIRGGGLPSAACTRACPADVPGEEENPTVGGTMDESGLRWFKSSASSAQGCVEVAHLPQGGVAVRDTKDRTKAAHRYTGDEWQAFLAGAKNGEFDLPA